jgi:hypothetical protein
LTINGPGIGQTLATHDGWIGGKLTLLAGSKYKFISSASDEGGTRLLRMQIPTVITVELLRPENATSRDLSPLSKMLELTNNDESPARCLIMNGHL